MKRIHTSKIINENKRPELKLFVFTNCLKITEEKLLFIEKKLQLLVSSEQYEGLITTDKVVRQELMSSTCGCC